MPTGSLWDEELQAGKKALRTLPGALLLGSTGARLWADYVEPRPGFAGRFDFIHKINIPLLYAVTAQGIVSFEPCRTQWFPSHLLMEYESGRLSLTERKFIAWDDCAVSCQTWTNGGKEDLVLRLETYEDLFSECEGGTLQGTFEIEHYSFDVTGVIAVSEPGLLSELRIRPGETKELIVAGAFGIDGRDSREVLRERALRYVRQGTNADQIIAEYKKQYQSWFDKTPVFRSSDELLNKTWAYRWFLLRHNLADPQYGHLQHPLFYEGRSHKKSKKPFGKGGWEFSKLINLSVPLHLMDARWYHDPVYCEGSLQNMKEGADENGMYCCMTVDTIMHSFANFSCWAAYKLYLVHRNRSAVERLLPSLKQQVASWKRIHGNDADQLLIEHKHTRTGKEYQPSYWYFHNYPRNPKDKATYTHLKRVDRAVYHYLNTQAVAKLCEAFGDPEAEAYAELAGEIKRDIIAKMWDEETQFFYDLHYETDEKAMVKNIVGIYPGWAEMIDERFDGMIEHLQNEREFRTRCPFPSVSADCPAYSKEGGWMGHFVKGRNGCVWDGPTWPYTNSIALDALAKESKRRNHRFDGDFAHYFREYSFLHFMQRDLNQPGLVEHYNSETGEPLSDEQEYNHSYYIDLLISHVAGLNIEQDKLIIDPIDIGLDYFCLDRVKAAGADIRISYRNPLVSDCGPDCGQQPLEAGYCVYVNGKRIFQAETLCRREFSLQQFIHQGQGVSL
ncbi:Beta-L-arabinobiosidase precursor [Paenibacillus konkukensis]|uniref:Beta-L-arabinobiosidase n=1 Tax=Paenibacillus konkukensis TaxID=2020716 RepID=A0ABY4RHA5_9BACL|nr:trehalase family glycosidase [Paenibacillus konkukensis]UQZ81826.1 Beta-L-arabinobiosidase precursor [Paenibacillus konkukensis]